MKILLAGGGTGGHFYPLIAVAQELRALALERQLVEPRLYYFADRPYDERLLFENDISFSVVPAGKVRRYFSLANLSDLVKTGLGVLVALWKLFWLYPDVVFSKGGYAAFPVLLAARFLGIAIVIHESDSDPGRVSLWSGKFARRVAVAFPEAAQFFAAGKTAVVGNPIRPSVMRALTQGAAEFLKLEPGVPVVTLIGGSQGAAALNDTLIDIVPELVERYQVIHQCGESHFDDCQKRSSIGLAQSTHRERYKLFAHLNETALQMSAGVSSLVITRAGAGAIFEIANWNLPAIIVPIPEEVSHDQRKNAFSYARSGAAVVIEQANLTPSVLRSEIDRLVGDAALQEKMRAAAKKFARPEAGRLIAEELVNIALEHEGTEKV